MIKKSSVKQTVKYAALILLGMLLSTSLTGNATEQPAPPQDASAAGQDAVPAAQLSSLPASPNAVWTSCTPENIAAYTTRVHVKCTAAVGGIQYFAVSTSNAAFAARTLSVLSTAQVAGRTLNILYEPDDTSNLPPGCMESDCRALLAASFGQ